MSTIKNILTFGAYGRIEEAMEKYNKVKKRYNSRLHKMKSKSREVDAVLETVVQVKIEAIKNLNTFKEFSVGYIENQLYNSNKFKSADFKHINQTLEKGQLALTASAGVAIGATAGVGTALATWGLASTLGAASTGTAISTLSGAAATNATLALLGGGAVAAGGGGMIAGATVLAGIVAIPALVALGVFSHLSAKKKIAEIESAIYKMKVNMCKMDTNIIRLKEIQKKSNKLIRLIKKKSKNLKYELNIANRIVNGEMSKITSFYHQIRTTIFNRSVTKLANEISILIDTPIFNEDTKKVHLNKTYNQKNATHYIMLAVFLIAVALYILAVPMNKDVFPFNTFSKSDFVNNITDKMASAVNTINESNLNEDYDDVLEQAERLTQAVESGDIGLVKSLLNAGVDPNIDAYESPSALKIAKYNGYDEIADLLIEAGAKGEYDDQIIDVVNAINNGENDYLKLRLESGLDPNSMDEDGTTLLVLGVLYHNLEAVKLLLSAGADPNFDSYPDGSTDYTPLMYAAQNDNKEILIALIEAGADINKIESDTALIWAIREGRTEIVKELINRGADVNPPIDSYSPLNEAEYYGNSDIIELLIQVGAKNY